MTAEQSADSVSPVRTVTAISRVAAPILAVVILQAAGGILSVLVPLAMDAKGLSALSAGLVAAAYAIGFMSGALYAPRIIRDVGHIRAFAAAAGIGGALTLTLYMRFDGWAWAPLRLASGFCIAVLFTAAESWINSSTPRERRGGVIGIYQVVTKMTVAMGPFLIAGHAALGPDGFMLAAAFFAISLVPVCFTPHAQPALPSADPFPLQRIWEVAPAAVVGAFLAGFTNQGILAILPIYAARAAQEAHATDPAFLAAAFVAATWIGSTVFQWPAGRLSDHYDRRAIIAWLGVLELLGALPLMIFGPGLPFYFALPCAFLWGAGALSYYGVCVAHATDRAPPEQAARVVSGLLFVWSAGSIIGPGVAGAAFDSPLGGHGLFGVAVFGALTLIIFMWGRQFTDAAVEVVAKVPFFASPPSPSMVMAEMAGDSASEPRLAPGAPDEKQAKP
ncbi:MAG: MFS transporter [Caulobacterales bacterium]